MKKILLSVTVFALTLFFSFSASAQQNAVTTEDVGYELPAMVSSKTVSLFDDAFANMPGVKVSAYCFSMSLVVFSVDRSVQKDNSAIEQKIRTVFNADSTQLRLESKPAFNKASFLVMCNEHDLITR